jgi:hypothetical protein
MAAAIAQAQEISKAARIKAFDIAAPANVQRRHFRMIRANRFGKSSPTPPVTLLSTLYPHIPPVYLRPTSLSSHLTTLLPSLASYPLPSLLPYPPTRSDSPRQFQAHFPVFLYSYPPILLHPLSSYPQIRLLQLPIPLQFRCRAF